MRTLRRVNPACPTRYSTDTQLRSLSVCRISCAFLEEFQILAERGAVCVTPIAQDDLGDGSGSPPLPPGAPPSWAGVGLGSLAPLNKRDAFPGGGFAAVTAGGGRLRFISAAPASAQLVTPGTSGGGGLGGGGQGHFVAAKVIRGFPFKEAFHLKRLRCRL